MRGKLIEVETSRLKAWSKNPREISEVDIKRLRGQLELGQYKPLIVVKDGNGYEVIGGNMRLEAFKKLKVRRVWVNVIEPKNEAEKIEISLSDNDSSGVYDREGLKALVSRHEFREEELSIYKVDIEDNVLPLSLLVESEKYKPVDIEEPDVGEGVTPVAGATGENEEGYLIFSGRVEQVKLLKQMVGWDDKQRKFNIRDLADALEERG